MLLTDAFLQGCGSFPGKVSDTRSNYEKGRYSPFGAKGGVRIELATTLGICTLAGSLDYRSATAYQPEKDESSSDEKVHTKVPVSLYLIGDRLYIASDIAMRQYFYGHNTSTQEYLRYCGVQANIDHNGRVTAGQLVGHYAGRLSTMDVPSDGLGPDVDDDGVYPTAFLTHTLCAPTCLSKETRYHENHPLFDVAGSGAGYSLSADQHTPATAMYLSRRLTDDYKLVENGAPTAFLGIRMVDEWHLPHPDLRAIEAGRYQVLNDPVYIRTWVPTDLDTLFHEIDGVSEWDWAFGVDLSYEYSWSQAENRVGLLADRTGYTSLNGDLWAPNTGQMDSQALRECISALGQPLSEVLLHRNWAVLLDVPFAAEEMLISIDLSSLKSSAMRDCLSHLVVAGTSSIFFGCDGELVYRWAKQNEELNLQASRPKDPDQMALFTSFCEASKDCHHVFGLMHSSDAALSEEDLRIVRYLKSRELPHLDEEIDGATVRQRRNRLASSQHRFVHRFASPLYEFVGSPISGQAISAFLLDADRQVYKVRIGEQAVAETISGYFDRNPKVNTITMGLATLQVVEDPNLPEGTIETWYGSVHLEGGRAPTIKEIEAEGGLDYVTLKLSPDVQRALDGVWLHRMIRGTSVGDVSPEGLVHEFAKHHEFPWDLINFEGGCSVIDLLNRPMHNDVCFRTTSAPNVTSAEKASLFLEMTEDGRSMDWLEHFMGSTLLREKSGSLPHSIARASLEASPYGDL